MKFGVAFLAAVLIFSLNPAGLQAQTKPYEIGFKVTGGIPVEEFGDLYDEPGFGVEGYFGYQLDHMPLTFGYELSYFNFGRNHQDDLSVPGTAGSNREITTNNNIASFRLLGRLGPQTGGIRPYADALAGFNYHYTLSRVRDDQNAGLEKKSRNLVSDDFAWTYGIGAGIKIRVQEINRIGLIEQWFLDFRSVYTRSEAVHFVLEGPIAQTDGSLLYTRERSPVDILSFQFGFTIYFSKP